MRILSFIQEPVIVRYLSKESYGEYATVISVISLITAILGLKTEASIRKYIADHTHDKDKLSKELCSTGLVTGLLFILSLIVSLPIAFSIITKKYVSQGIYLAFTIPLIAAFTIYYKNIDSIVFGAHRARASTIGRLLYRSTHRIGAILLVVLGLGIWGIFASWLTGLIVGSIFVSYFVIAKIIPDSFELKIDYESLGIKKYVTFGIGVTIATIFTQALYQLDILLVRYFTSASSAAMYKAALLPAHYVWLIPNLLKKTVIPSMSEVWVKKSEGHVTELFSRHIRYTVLASLLGGLGIFTYAGPFVEVYFGPSYAGSIVSLKILVVGSVCYALSTVTGVLFHASGKTFVDGICMFIVFALNLVLNVLLIPTLGIVGAAIATSISYTSTLFVKGYALYKSLGLNMFSHINLGQVVFIVITWLLVNVPLYLLINSEVLLVIIGFIMGTLSYILICIMFGAVSKKEVMLYL